jgi:hypothetical protein
MADECNNNPRDDSEERFSKLEVQVSDISRNRAILVAALESKFRPFREFGSSSGKSGVKEEPKRERPSSNITSFGSLFEEEAKVDIKPYQGEIDFVKMNQSLQQLEACYPHF